MKKRIILRGMLGFPLGIALGYVITVISSLIWEQGYYSPCIPELVNKMGNEINAVLLQTVLCGLIGTTCAASSVIWEISHWSIIKQTGIYFLITAVVIMPVAYITNWMEHSITGFLSYFGIFSAIFIFVWIFQYLIWHAEIKKLNAKVDELKE